MISNACFSLPVSFNAGLDFKTTIQIHPVKLWVGNIFNFFQIIQADAARQKEWHIQFIIIQHPPIKGFTRTAVGCSFGIEQEIIYFV
jgi:hypothetical protein